MAETFEIKPGASLLAWFVSGYCVACRKEVAGEPGLVIHDECLPVPGQMLAICCNDKHNPSGKAFYVNVSIGDEVHRGIDDVYLSDLFFAEKGRAYVVFISHCKECDPDQNEKVTVFKRSVLLRK